MLAGCGTHSVPADQGNGAATTAPIAVTLMLDWVPNVNHTGIFVAQDQGYFTEQGLSVNIIQPGEVIAEQAVASGAAEFGISFQEQVTLLHAGGDSQLVSLAAIFQRNTSGFASRTDSAAASPADWAGMTYGSFGSPFEEPTLKALMTCAGGDFNQLAIVDTGFTDPLALLQTKQIDLAWIFFGTQGIAAEQEGIQLSTILMSDHTDCIPDYYTPVLITRQQTIDVSPEMVRSFVTAVSRGYTYAAEHPAEAAAILLTASPESDEATLRAQQEWSSPRYQAEADRWGDQTLGVWQAYSQWMVDQGIIDQPIDAQAAFTTQFLP
jgi:ABC-type nitrate/sulfonate/bicarbonate transport system substrate-binding protein